MRSSRSLALVLLTFLSTVSTAHAATLAAPPNNLGLQDYWTFDENAGTLVHDVGGGRVNAITTGTTWVAGKRGRALSFNGTSDKVTAPNVTVGTNFTISAWIKKTSSTGQKSFFSNRGGSGAVYAGLQNDKVFLYDTNGTPGSTLSGAGAVTMGVWQHITITSNGSTITMYVNGVQVTQTGQTRTASTGTVGIGWDPNIGTEYWDGSIDDVRLYNRVLSPAEVATLYAAGETQLSAGASRSSLAGEWLLNEGGGTIANDTSGNNRDGTITAGSWVPGRHGQALSFDGASSVVQTLGFPSQSVGKGICAWVNPATSQSGLKGLVIQEGGFYLRLNNMALEARVYNSAGATSNTYSTSATLPVGKWSHVCETVDASSGGAITLNFYINGVSALSQATDVNGPNTGGVGTNYMKIGNDDDAAGRFFQGTIDDVVVYNRLLSASEIVTIYNEHATQVNSSQNSKLTGSLVGLWSFDGPDITTSFLDKSGNGFNGYLVGTNNATSSRKTIGREGQAFSFGGLNTGGINLGSSSTLDPNRFTIATWVYTPVASSYIYNYIFSNARDCCGTYNGIELLVGYNGAGVVTGTIWNSTAFVINSSAAAVPNNTWTHVVFTYDGSNMKLYINGVLNNSVAQTTDPGTPASFNTYIGSMGAASGVTYTFNGKLDDMRLYNRALSAAEIKQLYRMGK